MSADPETGAAAAPRRRRERLADVGSDPDYRFSLANERTFLAWIRTSLALIAGGVAVVHLAPALGPRPIRLTLGIVLVVVAAGLALLSHHRWASNERAMRLAQSLPPNRFAPILAVAMGVVAMVVLVLLIVGGTSR